MQADYQRSRFWKKEFGGILTNNGGVVRAPARYRHDFAVDFDLAWQSKVPSKGGVLMHYHTHWAKAGLSFNVDLNLDVDSASPYRMTTTQGPSPQDYSFAGSNGVNGFVIDRTSIYLFNSSSHINLGNGGMLRTFPIIPFFY